MIWLAAILCSVFANTDVACIMIAEKAFYKKAEVVNSILREHPEFKKNDLRQKITQDVFYFCKQHIEQDEGKVLRFDHYNSFSKFTHLMRIYPSKYKTIEDLETSLSFEMIYEELIEQRRSVINKLKDRPDLTEEEKKKRSEAKEALEEKKNAVKKPLNQRNKGNDAKDKNPKVRPEREYLKIREERPKSTRPPRRIEVNLDKLNRQVESKEIPQNSETKKKEDL